jgi:hypothetical protein
MSLVFRATANANLRCRSRLTANSRPVKLAGPLGAYLGWLGATAFAAGLLAAWPLGAVTGLGLLLVNTWHFLNDQRSGGLAYRSGNAAGGMSRGEPMRRHRVVMVVAAAAAVWYAVPLPVTAAPLPVTAAPTARAVARAATWGTAIEVPGLRALNQGGRASLDSLSCGSPGNCVTVGEYPDAAFHYHAFLAGESNGAWRRAAEVPGTSSLDAGGGTEATSVSCATAGNCAAGLTYTSGTGPQQAFVASEANGAWGTAIAIPGLDALNAGGNASVTSVSCATAGTCAAGGTYTGGAGHTEAFVVSQS